MEAGEVIVMRPLVQQRVEKHLGTDHLLAHRGAVIDTDACCLDRSVFERASVVAIRLALQTLSVVGVHLSAVGYDQGATGETRKDVKLVEEQLSKLATLDVVL